VGIAKRILVVLVVAAVTALAITAVAGASGGGAKLQLRKTRVGTILVNSRGYTLYAFTRDGRNRDSCVSIADCLRVWPALTTSGRPVAGRGVKASLIGTISLKGHGTQVTYAGHPLYTYIADTGPGDTSYVNILQFGGRWPAMNAGGGEVK
jgi:predicted lipoprotein with Yx(FWY)xxD motif